MAWTYDVTKLESADSDGVLTRIRFMSGDTEAEFRYLQDEEIMYLYNKESDKSELQAAILSVKRIIAKVAKQINYTIGPERVNAQYRMSNFEKLLTQLELETRDVENLNFPRAQSHEPIFNLGMMDNPRKRTPWGW
ncbi:MAG: hypothetical protein ACRCX2_30180 [Paraclostridium sp.]